MPDVIAVASGGMDSATLVYDYLKHGYEVDVLAFDYGQRHVAELNYANDLYNLRLDLQYDLVDIFSIGELLNSSALTNPDIDVPEGHYAEETMKSTVVPNRNAIMLNVAIGVAIARSAAIVATAVHAGDHHVYPDCRPEFIWSQETTALIANEGHILPGFSLEAPFVDLTKREIALKGDEMGVPWEKTWSCYKGGARHCGRCSTCVERLEALDGLKDDTEYVDTEYWRSVVDDRA